MRQCPYCFRWASRFRLMCDVCRVKMYTNSGLQPPNILEPILMVVAVLCLVGALVLALA